MNYKKLMHSRFMKNTKAISPIFATLILIAIAVIAGIIVYMFTSGYLSSMASNTSAVNEKLSIPSASLTGAIVTNTGDIQVTVAAAILKDSTGATIDTDTAPTNTVIAGHATGSVTFSLTPTALVPQTYTVTIVTQGGGNFVSAPFTV